MRAEKLKEKEAVQKAKNVRAELRDKKKFLDDYDRRMAKAAAKDAEVRKAKEQSKLARAKIQYAEEVIQRKLHAQGPIEGEQAFDVRFIS